MKKNIFPPILMLLYCGIGAWMLYAIIGGLAGLLIATGLMLTVLLVVCRRGVGTKEVSLPMLAYALMAIVPAALVFTAKEMEWQAVPFLLLTVAAGLVGLVWRFSEKAYKGKPLTCIMDEEFRLPLVFDLFLIIWLVNDGIEDRMYPYGGYWVLLSLIVIDFLHNIFRRVSGHAK